jgi:protein-tyrosine phosphatase
MDVQSMYESGVTAVLDIQTPTDHRQRGVMMERMLRMYKGRGINLVINYPVSDVKEDDYLEQLFEASQHMHELIGVKGQHVFVHCSSGVSRAPTLVVVYLALFLRHK